MELFEADKHGLQSLWEVPREKQRVQMILFQAIADSTELSAKEVDGIIQAIDSMLTAEKVTAPKADQAL